MTKPRASQISLSDTPYYHCVTRCVRRAFLCGKDVVTGKSYEHRRVWVEQKLLSLVNIFAIEVCAYAVMSNHTHVVLFVDQQQANAWSIDEVLSRWHQLHKGTLLTQRYMQPTMRQQMTRSEIDTVVQIAEVYRSRLYDISWFMRHLNESIARQANKEDACTGRFWEGRFKSQALLDEAALAACMAYVDLNPIRAGMAKTPENSAFTSIKQRCKQAKHHKAQPKTLGKFVGNPRKNMPQGIPFRLIDYLQLVDITGRCIRTDKKGFISASESPILQRLNITEENWLAIAVNFERYFGAVVGNKHSVQRYKINKKQQRLKGMSNIALLLAG